MATGNVRNNTIIGVEKEVTEGTYVAPSGTTSFIQPLDGFDLTPSRETLDRGILTSSIGRATPRLGMKSVANVLPVEYRASGTAGGAPDFGPLLEGGLGATRSNAAVTSKASAHTSTEIEIEDADIASFAVGDVVMVKEAGAFELRPISVIDSGAGTASITFPFALTNGAPSASVVVEAYTTYHMADTGHPALSLSYYWANEIRQAAIGAKVTSVGIDNFTVGQLASFNFGLEGLDYTEIDGAAPFTPAFDSGLPPVLLNACIWQAGTLIEVNTFSLALANTLGFITDLCDAAGKVASRVTAREITGTINPYMDDTTTTQFDNFDALTEFSLFVQAFTPSAVAGEMVPGSAIGLWLPQCITTEYKKGDLEGIVTDEVTFQAVRGGAGDQDEMFLGLI